LSTYFEENASLEDLLLLSQLGDWDPMNFHAYFPKIRQQLLSATPELKKRLLRTIGHMWENFYPIAQEDGHFVMNLGVLCFEMAFYEEALLYFERSVTITGENEKARQNIDVCKELVKVRRNQKSL
jgi:hypothetical protein